MKTRFLDTNVLVYALIESRRRLSNQDQSIIKHARGIIRRIEDGETALSSVVHLSEFINILQRRVGVAASNEALECLLGIESLDFMDVEKDHFVLALELSKKSGVGANDCLAAVLMSKSNIDEIYSFDADFDRLGVKRIVE